jgi:hypothetical protein
VAIFEAGVVTTAPAATIDVPYAGLWNLTGGNRILVREIGLCSTAATTSRVGIKRTTARGTQTTTLLGSPLDTNDNQTVTGTVDSVYSANPTLTGNYLRRGLLANVVGASLLWSWWNSPLVIAQGAGIQLCNLVATAAGALEAWFVWEA